jgi:hypothetical protein
MFHNSHLAVNTNTGSALGDQIARNIASQLKSNDDYFNAKKIADDKAKKIAIQSPYPQPGHFTIYH